MGMDKLLVIDDSIPFLNDVEALLKRRYLVVKATTGSHGLDVLATDRVSAVLLDLKLPDAHGIDILRKIRTDIDPYLPVIIVSDETTPETIAEAMRSGAYDFISKDFNLDILSAKILKALERRELEIQFQAFYSDIRQKHDRMVFASDAMKRVHFEVTRLASQPFDVLIAGETGVGKDLIAYEIHRRSPRVDKPFVSTPMRALSETLIESELFGHERGAFSGADRLKIGKLEAADEGTLYIPEVSSLTESIQLKLLQFLQYKTITRVGQDSRKPEIKLDVRVILATNERLEALMDEGKIRSDFYHRISSVRIDVPPLRERQEDIAPLARYFLQKYSTKVTGDHAEFSPETLSALSQYGWPGNVRELENWMKHAIALAADHILKPTDFPFPAVTPDPVLDSCDTCLGKHSHDLPDFAQAELEFKRAYMREALHRAANNIPRAAKLAGMTPQGFRKALATLKLKK
jgi:DNA-binding NtrC family response regulator